MKLNRILSTILSAIISITLLSGCEKSESVTEGTTISEVTAATVTSTTTAVPETALETTTEPTTTPIATSETTPETARELTAEELEIMNEMPEIVFVMSHHFSGENINGFYITKNGEVKMFDFKGQEEQVTYVPYVLDKLDDATCSEMIVNSYSGDTVKTEELKSVPEYKMVEYYKILLQIDKNSEIIQCSSFVDAEYGYGDFYGIRKVDKKTEIITLTGWGNAYNANKDELSSELNIVEVFPQFYYPY